jgi:hypothetical protein
MHPSNILIVCAIVVGVSGYANVQVGSLFLKNIDPILSPGKYESHLHTFFGSDAITKDMPTSRQLQAGCTTAKNPNDMSVYCKWRHESTGVSHTFSVKSCTLKRGLIFFI